MMTSADAQRDRKALEIFGRVLEMPGSGSRAGVLENACAGDEVLKARVEALLAHHVEDNFLQEPAGILVSVATVMAPVCEQPGERIGRYKLLEKIGEGGCGVVYMAEQEEPVRRKVALKVIRPGMDTKSVIARFEAERQALAMMDHPHIAKVHDGGVTDTGRPYFVMELVRGIRITDYCTQHNLSTRERLDLFTAVCSAVQHAHQKGIIHRDLKPSNILVTEIDGRPVPKVIDFGIARATEQKLTDKTLFTQFAQFIGTPAYMSPEQAAMSGTDIDTRSDIYSLGVLLYELLTGSTPFDARDLLHAGFDEMRRIIRETEPPKPSTRLTQTRVAADVRRLTSQPEVGGPRSEVGGRGSEVGGLKSALRIDEVSQPRPSGSRRLSISLRSVPHSALPSDLDWIVMKCLEKDRGRRYETASGLAQDIRRHLSSEPVTARPASAAYRFRKMVRRNKFAVAAGGAVAAALVAGVVVSTWQAVRATRAEHQAQENAKATKTEAEKSRQVAKFLKDMLKGVGPAVALGDDTKMLRKILDKTADRIGTDLKDQPEVEVELRTTIGKVYEALGDYDKAAAMLGEAFAITKKLHGEEHKDVVYLLNARGLVLIGLGKFAEAEAMLREALAMDRKLTGGDGDLSTSLGNLGRAIGNRGQYAAAEKFLREALAMNRKFAGNEHEDTAITLNNLAGVLQHQQKFEEAETTLREALAIQKKLFGPGHPDVAITLNNLSNSIQAQNKFEESELLFREVLPLQRKLMGNAHSNVAMALNGLALALLNQGRSDEAEPLLREGVEIVKKARGPTHQKTSTLVGNLGRIMEARGKFDEAEALYREALTILGQQPGPEHPRMASWRSHLVNLFLAQKKWPEVEAVVREELASARRAASGDEAYPAVIEAQIYLATVLAKQLKFSEAEALLLECNGVIEQNPKVQRKLRRDALSRLGDLYEAWSKPDKATEWRQKLAAFEKADAAPDGEPKAESSKP